MFGRSCSSNFLMRSCLPRLISSLVGRAALLCDCIEISVNVEDAVVERQKSNLCSHPLKAAPVAEQTT